MELKYCISETKDIKSFLKENYYSLEVIHHLFNNLELIKINDKPASYPFILNNSDILSIKLPDEKSNQKSEEAIINIVYEDEFILIVNKPKDLATISTSAHYHHNLGSQVLYYFEQNDIKSKVHFINRLDKETQGLVLIAKHQYIHNLFAKTVNIKKKYKCLVNNIPNKKEGYINLPIGKLEGQIKRFIDFDNGKDSLTEYRIIDKIENNTLLDITLHSGRTHQIRLHLASIGCPLVGDPLYNDNKNGEFFLQSYYLEFVHPITKKLLKIEI